MSVLYTVYQVVHVPTGRKYIGQTVQRLSVRWAAHKYCAKIGRRGPLYDAMRELPHGEFTAKALAIVPTREYALMCEKGLILAYNTRETGFNLSLGVGSEGCVRDEAFRQRVSHEQKGRKHSEKTKAKMRAARLGRSMTAETKEKLRQHRTGLKWSDEARAKASESKRGKPWSDVRRQRLQDPEYRAKMKAASIKGVEALRAKRENADV